MKVSFAASTYHARTQHKYLRLFFVQDKQGVKPDIQFLSKSVLARIRNGILNIMFFQNKNEILRSNTSNEGRTDQTQFYSSHTLLGI